MKEFELKKTIQKAIESTHVGEKVTINFKGIPQIIDVEMSFAGGWIITQTIIPGKPFEFIRGENQYLNGITITINPYDGIKLNV